MSDVDQLLRLVGEKSRVITRVGVYVGVQGGQALIDMGGERFPAAPLAPLPAINDPVHVWSVDGSWFVVGMSRAQPTAGTVLTVTSPRATVDTSVGVVAAIIGGSEPSSGQRVVLHWTEDGPVTGAILATTPATPPVPPDPGGGGSQLKEQIFRAVDAGSTDRGSARWWQAEPWASNTTYGAWFYGSQIKDTIPTGATFVTLELYINRVQDQGAAPRFALHNSLLKGHVPGYSSYTEWDPGNGWQVPPDPSGWFAALKAGGLWAGVGLNQGGYNRFASLARDGMSGALRIRWR